MAANFAVGPTVTRADIPGLCTALAESLRGRAGGVVLCDLSGVTRPDVVTVEALARLRMTARRHGWRLTVGAAAPELVRLIGLLGLADLFPPADRPGQPDRAARSLQVGRQPEEREQAVGVEEVVDGGDAPR